MTYYGDREKCYKCYRPKSSCMCSYIDSIKTDTKFIVLMHPKEFKKVKNGTGHLTHLSLSNSKLFVGVNFTNHKEINEIIDSHKSFVLYPSKNAINISEETLEKSDKDIAIFIIDSTWSCSTKMLLESKNLQKLDSISFTTDKLSQFKIKEQPQDYCLSTIESTLEVLKALDRWKIEDISKRGLDNFLNPFHKMVKYQLDSIDMKSIRFKKRGI